MMLRPEVLALLAKHRTDEAVITTFRTFREWPHFTNNPALDYPARGSMGQSPLVGLGIALARPERRVWVLNGDGSQLMYLSSLATIANAAPRNLVLFIFENDRYETTGGQPIPLASRLDFAAVARGLTLQRAYTFQELSDLEARLPEVLRGDGPTLVVLKAVQGEPLPRPPRPEPAGEALRFRGVLAGAGA